MAERIVKRKGARVGANDSALDAIHEAMPHWIHHTRENASYVNGIMYLPQCDCSVCGYTVNNEKERCPHCGVKMVSRIW